MYNVKAKNKMGMFWSKKISSNQRKFVFFHLKITQYENIYN